jgi:hypothetical protein
MANRALTRLTLGAVLVLWTGCAQMDEAPTFVDAAADIAPPDTASLDAADTAPADTVIDTPPDSSVDTTPDATIDTPPDSSVDTTPDTAIDTPADTAADTPADTAPADTAADTCTPDCSDRECGPDPVCSTSCGTCTPPETCEDGQCVTAGDFPENACSSGGQGRDGCGDARIIGRDDANATYVVSDDTCSADDRHDGDCSVFDVGNDHTYAVYMQAGEVLDLTLQSHSTKCDSDDSYWSSRLKLFSNPDTGESGATSCPTFIVCWIGPPGYETWDLLQSHTATADGWVFIVVDGGASGFDEHRGYYTLTVTLSAGC